MCGGPLTRRSTPHSLQTSDNYAVRVMFEEDPYTFSLFDTPAGLFCSVSYASHLKGVLSDRSGGPRPSPSVVIRADRHFPRLFQRRMPSIICERQGEVVPRGEAPLPGSPMSSRRAADRSERRPYSDREAGQPTTGSGH